MSRLPTSGLKLVAHIGALTPLALIIWDLAQDQLTADPIREIQRRTGKAALVLLILSLVCTPLSQLPRLQWVLPLRRFCGLYAFAYASLHLLNFIGLDYGFDLSLLRQDLPEKRFIFLGLATLLSLLPLAVTSTAGWRKRLGRNWQRLHWLIYLAAPLAVTHFFLSAKADRRTPLLYGAVVVLLLLARLPEIRKMLRHFHH